MKINKGMRALSLLMVMALLTAVFIPAVSAEGSLNSDQLQKVNDPSAIIEDEITGNQNSKIIPVTIMNNAQEKSELNRTTWHKTKLLTPVPASNLKNIKVPDPIKSVENQEGVFTDDDWAFLKKSMIDLAEKEQDQLIIEMKKIQNNTSKLNINEQNKIIAKIGKYIVIATEGINSVKMPGQPGHYQLSMAVSQYLGTMTTSHADSLGNYAIWADNDRGQPPLFGLIQNRHSWVLDGTGIFGFDDYSPDSSSYFITNARTNFNNYLSDDAYINIGKSLHYVEDMGCPYHTTGGSLLQHVAYEDWIMNNWNTLGLDTAIQVSEYYIVTDPVAQAKELAEFSHQFLSFFTYEIDNDPDWQTNPDMIYYTQVLFKETEKMTIGMVQYANKFESPDTTGSNSVAINDLQSSYAYINSVGGSQSDLIPILISHPDTSELEIWVGCRQDSGYGYTDYKVWDRQAIGGSELVLYVTAAGFENMHDWRLMVRDNAAGNTGSINEFSIHIS